MSEWCTRRLTGRKVTWPARFIELVGGEPVGEVVGAMSPVIVIARHSNGKVYPLSVERVE